MAGAILKSKKDIEVMSEGGRKLAEVKARLKEKIDVGVSAMEIEDLAVKLIEKEGGESSFKMVPNYEWATCVNLNEGVVHGIPNEQPRVLREGDIVTLDSGLIYGGLFTDMAVTVAVGKVDQNSAKLISAAREALEAAIATVRPGVTTGDIGAMVEATATKRGFSVARELGGHGVGRAVHEEPFVPNYGSAGTGTHIEEGMVLAIEPILIDGSGEVELASDGYTYVTTDGSRSAQFEHTVLVTNDGAVILTARRQ